MNKRRFLQALVGSVLAVPPAVRARSHPAHRVILIQQSPLAGFPYHAGESVWGEMREGDMLALVREPQNPHDPRAVRVNWQGYKLGYLPHLENTAVAQMLDRGERIAARIVRLQQSPDPWERVRLAVELVVG